MSLVNISIVGNLVRPPEQIYFASGRVKTNMMVAVNSRTKNGEVADFYKVEAWGKLAELAGKYLSKGNQVAVTGRLTLDRWTDKEGKERITPTVEVAQLSLPPRLKVVNSDEQTEANSSVGANPIGGEIDASDQEGEPTLVNDESAYGIPFESEEPPSKKTRKSQTA